MKGAVVWLLAVGGGAGVGALGGTAWLMYQGAPPTSEVMAPSEEPRVEFVSPDGEIVTAPEVAGSLQEDEPGPMATQPTDTAAPGPLSVLAGDPLPFEALATEPAMAGQTTVNHERLGRIFAAMRPAEAAAVLGQLDDVEISGILMTMPARNAAPILAGLDPVRAASLSRRVLGGRVP